jgi:AP-2 complex subunit alpha
VDFGHTEVINLVSAGTYAEKTVGYLAASVLLKNTDEQITLIVQCIRNDLQSAHDSFQCLALSSIANIGGTELADALAPEVQRLMMSRTTFPVVRKRSTLCMLRLFRVNPDTLPVAEWADRIVSLLSDDTKNFGVILAACTLILGVIDKDSKVFSPAVPQVGHS